MPIDLIVRGQCELKPGIPNVSETIAVRSIVGRFLEHSRIYIFTNGGDREIYIGSADWMGRNLDRRVETIVPVLDPDIQDKIVTIVEILRADNVKTRWLLPDGTYTRRLPGEDEPQVCAHEAMLEATAAL